MSSMTRYLACSKYIDWDHPAVAQKAVELSDGCSTEEQLVKRCFEFVRDSIKHSLDFNLNPVTCSASEVLLHGTGFCYAKSHLLAALLRANGIPAGLCYQRLSIGTQGPPFCLHGLNAVYLQQYGWSRVDARGNKPGVNAQFSPPVERLAFPIISKEERDFPEIWLEPLPCIIKVLNEYSTVEQVAENLPDIEVISAIQPYPSSSSSSSESP
ncbi:MAG: transglutaminase family protein [Thermoguttaceae bacterium]